MKETFLKDKGYVTSMPRNGFVGLDKNKINLDYISELEQLQKRVRNYVCTDRQKKGIRKLIERRTKNLESLKQSFII